MSSPSEAEIALAQPDAPSSSSIEAWYMDESSADQRAPHQRLPNEPVSLETLHGLGVLYWKLDADKYEDDPKLAAVRKVRNYTTMELITISKDKLPGYEEKIKSFFEEHIHTDEEIRFVLDGSGYFDVRDGADRWIRIKTKKGDMIVLPEGIYHRFTLDEHDYIKAMRLFVGVPVWTPLNRPQDDHESRRKYLAAFDGKATSASIAAC